jgi:hypothetical protein
MLEWRSGLMAATMATVCVAGTAAGQPQQRQMGGVGITVFDDIGYRGENATFRSDQPDLGSARFANRISSLQVAPGEVWEVCEGVNYRQPCQVFSGMEPDLRRRSWNDRISSLRRIRGDRGGGIFPPGPPSDGNGLVLYSDERFRGQARTVNGPTPSLGSFNDRARSVRVYSGTWEVCEDIDYGKCRTVNRDVSDLTGLGLSKRVSSVRPAFNGRGGYPPSGPPPQLVRLVLYDRDRYRGGSRTIDAAEGSLGGFGNRAQSLQVIGTWQLCDGPNFTGRCVTVSQNVPNLSSYGMTNRVSSARPLSARPR